MEEIDVKEEIRKDVNEYIRQAEKLDGNKPFKKTYDEDKDFCYLVEMDGSKMKITMLLNRGVRLETVSKCLGHCGDLKATRIYAKILEETVISEVAKVVRA